MDPDPIVRIVLRVNNSITRSIEFWDSSIHHSITLWVHYSDRSTFRVIFIDSYGQIYREEKYIGSKKERNYCEPFETESSWVVEFKFIITIVLCNNNQNTVV